MSDRDRLAELGKKRRLELGRKQQDVARLARISRVTVAAIEKGEPVKEFTLWKYDKGLDWEAGSAAAILNGGDPLEVRQEVGAPNWPPREIPPETIARLMPVPGEKLTHPEDLEAWRLDIPEDERRWLIAYRRALRVGDDAREQFGR